MCVCVYVCVCVCECVSVWVCCCATAILLGHLKLPHNTIKLSLLACDTSRLSEQHLQQLETFAPDSKEVSSAITTTAPSLTLSQCKEYTKYYSNITVLSLPDRFSCEVRQCMYVTLFTHSVCMSPCSHTVYVCHPVHIQCMYVTLFTYSVCMSPCSHTPSHVLCVDEYYSVLQATIESSAV